MLKSIAEEEPSTKKIAFGDMSTMGGSKRTRRIKGKSGEGKYKSKTKNHLLIYETKRRIKTEKLS